MIEEVDRLLDFPVVNQKPAQHHLGHDFRPRESWFFSRLLSALLFSAALRVLCYD